MACPSFGAMNAHDDKPLHYSGEIDHLPYTKIYLNIRYLKKGRYELNIMNMKKLIKKVPFKKK